MLKNKYVIIIAAVILFCIDRWLKVMAINGTIIDWPVGRFVLFKNYGIIFSWPMPNLVAAILMIFAIGIVGRMLGQSINKRNNLKIISGGLLLLGAISNLIDRLVYGYIIDWAYFGRWSPVFNLADAFIFCGLILYLTSNRKAVS